MTIVYDLYLKRGGGTYWTIVANDEIFEDFRVSDRASVWIVWPLNPWLTCPMSGV